MSLLPRIRFGKDRETEALEQRVSTLQAALQQCGDVAQRWTNFRREVTAVIAVLMLALGFTLGVYREPIMQSFVGMAQAIGLADPVRSADAAYAAYQNGNYASALKLADPLAAEGDARAQSILGLIYYRGRGVPQDHNEAVKWFRSAADRGDVAAQFYLGFMYSEGQGVPQDYAKAMKWFRLAADRGDPQAQYNLALLLFQGRKRGGGAGQYQRLYVVQSCRGELPPRPTPAAAPPSPNRDVVAHKMAADEIAEAQKRAREWKPK